LSVMHGVYWFTLLHSVPRAENLTMTGISPDLSDLVVAFRLSEVHLSPHSAKIVTPLGGLTREKSG